MAAVMYEQLDGTITTAYSYLHMANKVAKMMGFVTMESTGIDLKHYKDDIWWGYVEKAAPNIGMWIIADHSIINQANVMYVSGDYLLSDAIDMFIKEMNPNEKV